MHRDVCKRNGMMVARHNLCSDLAETKDELSSYQWLGFKRFLKMVGYELMLQFDGIFLYHHSSPELF